MSTSNNTVVKALDTLKAEIAGHRDKGMTYSAIGALYGVGKGNVWNVEHGGIPRHAHVRLAFGLDVNMNDRTQFNEIKICSVEGCNVSFIPNSHFRTRCFICSPYRKKGERR